MNQEQVVSLMESSRSEIEWNDNTRTVKRECGGYPDFWYATIVLSGLAAKVAARWGGDAAIKVTGA